MEFKVLGINSGLGVSLHPFKWHIIGNMEQRALFHTKKNEQWESNFGKRPIWKNYEDCKKYLDENKIKPNIIIGSPDCGSGSVLRYSRSKSLGNHSNNKSLQTFILSVQELKPRFFLFENLEGLFQSIPEEEIDEMFKKYHLVKHIVSVSKFGNSQVSRKRLIIVGIKKKAGIPLKKCLDIFSLSPLPPAIKTCRQLYGDLPETMSSGIGHIRELPGLNVTMFSRFKCTIAEARDHWQTELKGKKRWEVKDRKFSTAPGVYRNLADDYPATARKANRQFDHNGQMLTPRQLARIQGVPDAFKIFVGEGSIGYWINKGRTVITKTPPYEISVWFKECLESYYFKN